MPDKDKIKRPEVVNGTTVDIMTGCGRLYVTLNEYEGNLFEVFATMGKAGGCASSQIEAIGRLISLALRSGIIPDEFVKQLKGIYCHEKGSDSNSCADAIGRIIEIHINKGKSKTEE